MGSERLMDVQPHPYPNKHRGRVAERWQALAELPALRDAPGEAFLGRKQVAALVGLAPATLARLAARALSAPGPRAARAHLKKRASEPAA
jgi:hypothetical protein